MYEMSIAYNIPRVYKHSTYVSKTSGMQQYAVSLDYSAYFHVTTDITRDYIYIIRPSDLTIIQIFV